MGETLIGALILGLIEGLTEFIPVSSTGHLVLIGHLIGFESTGNTFEVLIQLGAILAILTVYFQKILAILLAAPRDPRARRFILAVIIGFLPAAAAGAVLFDFVKDVLLETPLVVCIMLILGGIVLYWVELTPRRPRYFDAMDFPLSLAFKIGLCQMLAIVPGVSRSGSSIVGALLLGADRRSAAEFSFFLAMPTMAGAFTYDLISNWDQLQVDDVSAIAVGFVAAFVAAVLVVRRLLDFVSRRGYGPFAAWRIIVGAVGLIVIAFS